MRLIGIGLLASLLAGLALLLSNSEAVRLGLRQANDLVFGPQMRFETPVAPQSTRGDDTAVVYRTAPTDPLLLTGLPAYQGATFYMPIDARPTSGYLQIDATFQALTGVEGVLRISIGNTRRAEMLLRPGEAGRSMRIDLTSDEIAQERLVVSFSLRGEGPHRPCGIDTGFEAIVEIETTSAIFLTLDQPLETARDRAVVAGRQVQVVWPSERAGDTRQTGLIAAASLRQAGVAVTFRDDDAAAFTGEDLLELQRGTRARPRQDRDEFAWTRAVEPDSALFQMRRFQRMQEWRLTYDMWDAEDQTLPGVLALAMRLGPQPSGGQWQITVALNGRLVAHELLPASADAYQADIALPADMQERQNVIEIIASSTYDAPGECNDGPDLVAEITGETRLLPGASSYTDGILELQQMLQARASVSLDVLPGVNSAEATLAASTLAAVLPATLDVTATSSDADITVLPRGTPLTPWTTGADSGPWLVFYSEETGLTAMPIVDYPFEDVAHVAFVITRSGDSA